MAQGCILPISAEDSRQLKASLREPLGRQAIWGVERALEQRDAIALVKMASYPLTDPSDPAHGVFVESVLYNVAGNQSISQGMKDALPNALVIVAQQAPDVMGLVARSRGRGATALMRNFAHRTHGDAFAYELLGTAELIRMNRVHDSGSKPINGGPELRIWDSDRLDLGIRLPAGPQAHEGGMEGLFAPAGTGLNHLRHTIETDAFLLRDHGVVGIDFKHSRSGGTYSGEISASQLEGIANAMMTKPDGVRLREFHFVSNGSFSDAAFQAVEEMNERLSAALGCPPPIGLHEHLQFPLG